MKTKDSRETTVALDELQAALAAHADWIGSVDAAASLIHRHTKESTMGTQTDRHGTYVRDHLIEVAEQTAERIAQERGESEETYDALVDEVVNSYVKRHPGEMLMPPDVRPLIMKARRMLPERGTELDGYTAARVTAYATTAIAELLAARR